MLYNTEIGIPAKILIYVRASYATPQKMFNTIQDLILFMQMYSHVLNIIRFTPKLLDKANVDGIKIRHIDLLTETILRCTFNNSIAELNISQYSLHINEL